MPKRRRKRKGAGVFSRVRPYPEFVPDEGAGCVGAQPFGVGRVSENEAGGSSKFAAGPWVC